MFQPATLPKVSLVDFKKSLTEIKEQSVNNDKGKELLAGAGLAESFFEFKNQEFLDALRKESFINMLIGIEESHLPAPEPVKFNGKNIKQPGYVVLSDKIEVDFSSDRAECLVQQAAIVAAEKVILNGKVSDRFIIVYGMAPDAPKDCFVESKSYDPKFYLVDKEALDNNAPACLVQFCVSKDKKEFMAIPFEHPYNFGEQIIPEIK